LQLPQMCRFLGRRHRRRDDWARPASEKRQGTKSRDVGLWRCNALYGD
jgi:hypothetical protein